ncbi:MAG: hypothetical protein MJH09_10375 [Cetobacterium sp.]|nr:hypothetical protein [Cetobacterium sp.]
MAIIILKALTVIGSKVISIKLFLFCNIDGIKREIILFDVLSFPRILNSNSLL